MKAIIPVAGAGTKLRPHTYTQPKALIPVAGKPLLGLLIEQLQQAGIEEFVFVIGYLGDKIRSFIVENYPGLKAQFAVQEERAGLGHAIWTAKPCLQAGEEVVILLGDTIIDADLKMVLQQPGTFLGVRRVDDPRQFGVAEFDEDQRIRKVVEKPLFPKSNMALVGFYKIAETDWLMDALQKRVEQREKPEDEIHLTEAIMDLINRGVEIQGFKVNNWYDLGKREVLLETNAIFLQKAGFASLDVSFFENTIIIHPVHIAKGARISNSIIGPFVTIGEHTEIQYSILQNSIIGNFARLEQVILHGSIIGSDAVIRGLSQSLNIGDNTEIDLSGSVKS